MQQFISKLLVLFDSQIYKHQLSKVQSGYATFTGHVTSLKGIIMVTLIQLFQSQTGAYNSLYEIVYCTYMYKLI